LVALAVLATFVPLPVQSATLYTAVDIGDLGGGVCDPYVMNGAGHIAGLSFNAAGQGQYFVYDAVTGKKVVLPLARGAATGIGSGLVMGMSEYGHVVAAFQPSTSYTTWHGFRWTPTGANALTGNVAELPTLNGFDWTRNSFAVGVNSTGNVVGWSAATAGGAGVPRAVVWRVGVALPTPMQVLSTAQPSEAVGISDNGRIVGYSTNTLGLPRAMLWSLEGTWIDLGVLRGGTWAMANAIDPTGTLIVGTSGAPNGRAHAFSSTGPGTMTDLGVLAGTPAAIADSIALAVRAGQGVVGQATAPSGALVAALFDARGVTDLNTVIGRAPSGLNLDYAIGIDASGRILAHGSSTAGRDRCILLKP
jgi:probable HAF family extracellular repeat protein